MEAVAWLAGEKHSDHPACVSPVIGAFCRTWNDQLDEAGRQRLKPYIARVVGTAGDPGADEARAWLAADWMIRVHMPAWLELGGMREQAEALRALLPIDGKAMCRAAQPTINTARNLAAAARAAARDAAVKALEPTKISLQESAFQLLDRMIELGRKAA